MFKSFLVRIYPNRSQKEFFAKQFGCFRYVYNTFLDEKKLGYSLFHRNLSYNGCSKMLTEQKRYKEWLREVDSTALIQSLCNLETAFDRFFKGISNYPRYNSKYNHVQSYKTMNINNSIRIDGRRIRLPKIGMIKFHTKLIITGEITSVTVSNNNSGKYYAAILCKDVPTNTSKKNRCSCGIDLGITNFVTINMGEIISFPEQNKITHLDKKNKKIT